MTSAYARLITILFVCKVLFDSSDMESEDFQN